jgi:aminoglycoside phosphotransferase (APT) family kinase protein
MSIPMFGERDAVALGLPSEAEYVAHYRAVTGLDIDARELEFYLAFGMFRLAGIFHGIRGRFRRGTAVSGEARRYVEFTDRICDLAWAQAQRCDRL